MRKKFVSATLAVVASTVLVICLSGCGMTPEPAGQAAKDWRPAYTADFSQAGTLSDQWLTRYCKATLADGKLTVTPDRKGRSLICFDGQRFPDSVRVELTASVATAKSPGRLGMGICLNSDGFDSGTGYVFQFGAKGNTCSLLKKESTSWDTPVQLGIHDGGHLDRPVDATAANEVHPQSGKSYNIVAERDGDRLSLWVDGALAFSYVDASPIKGPENGFVGLVATDCTLTVEKFAVYTRPGGAIPARDSAAPPTGPVVTLAGVLICSRVAAAREDEGPHTPLLYAYDGTPQVRAELDRIVNTYFLDDRGLDVDRARKVQAEFDKNLRYSLADCHLTREDHTESHFRATTVAVTGVVAERAGVKWLYPTSVKVADFSPAEFRKDPSRRLFTYPAKMLAADKPIAPAGKTPLTLKISDALSMKCVLLPAGSFIQGSPFYQPMRWQDEYAHEVVLTKPFYMAEHPVTQEMFEAVMGKNPSVRKGPQFPVEQVAYKDIQEFCRLVSEKTGRTVRLPTDAEWEYAARVGTSSPCFADKYLDQLSRAGDAVYKDPHPVKSKAPNAWGIYDMYSGGWHVVSDYAANNVRTRQVDQKGPARDNIMVRDYGDGPVHKAKGGEYYDDWRPSMHGAVDEKGGGAEGNTIFNIVVEATPEEAAAMR